MLLLVRVLTAFVFFIPLLSSLVYFLISSKMVFDHVKVIKNFWSEYVITSSLLSVGIGLISVTLAVIMAFLVGFSIFSYRSDPKVNKFLKKIISVFLAVPHLAFFSGFVFLISSSGWISRVLHLFYVDSFYGFDHDPLALSFSVVLAIKESLFLLFTMLPVLFDAKNEEELLLTQSFGHDNYTYWKYVLWPKVIFALKYPIWMLVAYSVSVVDLSMVLGPTNPPSFSLTLWEFFLSADRENQVKSFLGCFQIMILLGIVITVWESLVFLFLKLIKLRLKWSVVSGFSLPQRGIIFFYFFLHIIPLAALGLWALTDEWTFPDLLPASYSLENFQHSLENILPNILVTVELGVFSAGISTLVCLLWMEWDERALAPWVSFSVLFVPIFPIVPLLFGFDVFLSKISKFSILKFSTFFSVMYAHIFLVFPYTFFILKSYFVKFDRRYKFVALSLGRSVWSFFLNVRLKMILAGLLTAFSVGFAVSVAQYVSTVFIGGGRIETLTTTMVVAVSGENRKWIGVFGILQIFLPALFFLFTQMFTKEKK